MVAVSQLRRALMPRNRESSRRDWFMARRRHIELFTEWDLGAVNGAMTFTPWRLAVGLPLGVRHLEWAGSEGER